MNPEQAAEIQAMTAELVEVNGSTYRAVHPDMLAALIKRRDELARLVDVHELDSARLDWLQEQTRGYGAGWICRESIVGRGMRLHETSAEQACHSVRAAIDQARGVPW